MIMPDDPAKSQVEWELKRVFFACWMGRRGGWSYVGDYFMGPAAYHLANFG